MVLMLLLMRNKYFWVFGSILWYISCSFVRWDKYNNDRGVDTVHVTESASHLPSGCVLSLNCSIATSITPWQRISEFVRWYQFIRIPLDILTPISYSITKNNGICQFTKIPHEIHSQNFWHLSDIQLPCEEARHTVWAQVKVTKVTIVPEIVKKKCTCGDFFSLSSLLPVAGICV